MAGQGRDGYAERAACLFRLAGLLKRYADQYRLAVVVTNQVHKWGPPPKLSSLHKGPWTIMLAIGLPQHGSPLLGSVMRLKHGLGRAKG